MRALSVFALLFLGLCLTPGAAARVYVDQNAPGPQHDGNSWDTAYLTIQEGVNDADALDEQVWVADGTYVENVVMGEGVAIYGGFLGAEPGGYEGSLDQRDWVTHVTTIDGNQSGSCVVMAVGATVDGFTITNGTGTLVGDYTRGGGFCCNAVGDAATIVNNTIMGNTAYLGAGIDCDYSSSPSIANNTITANSAVGSRPEGAGLHCRYYSSPTLIGNAVTENSSAYYGGGIACSYGAEPVLIENTIGRNSAGAHGGGIDCWEASPVLIGNTITGNSAVYDGGAVDCHDWWPTLMGNTIADNTAGRDGGAMYCEHDAWPTLDGNMIRGNSAGDDGGGIYSANCAPVITGNIFVANAAGDLAGGVLLVGQTQPTVANNVFTGNSAGGHGGAMYIHRSFPVVTNNTFAGNASDASGGALYCDTYASPDVVNNVVATNAALMQGGGIYCDGTSVLLGACNDVWANSPDDYYGCEPREGDISADPSFVDRGSGDFHLTADSPCIGAGTTSGPPLPESDWDGEDRIVNGTVDIGADEFFTWTATAPDPQPECDGALFGEPQAGFPGWIWFSVPMTPAYSGAPNDVLGFQCNGRLFRYDKYIKAPIVYKPPFSQWDLAVGDSYILWLDSLVANPSYEGLSPFTPWEFEFRMGRQGWTWVGMPGLTDLAGEDFMSSVKVKYPSDEAGVDRTAQEDYDAIPGNWVTWGWPYWNTWLQAPETFTPYAPFGHRTCYPWIGYRVWVKVGTAQSEDGPDQVTLVWPKSQ